MTDINKKIELTYRRQDFEDIYFKNGQGDIFWGKTVKQYFILVLIFAAIFLISLAYTLVTTFLYGIPLFFLFAFIISFFTYLKQASPTRTWKRQVIVYLNELDKIKKNEITLTNEALTITQDGEVTITKWGVFTKATLSDESIVLIGNSNYVFPRRSMGLSDYKYLKDFISDKVQNGI